MIETSSIRYVTLQKQGYENLPAIPLKTEEGKLWVLSFMSPTDKRLVWVRREDISKGELTQMKLI